MNSAQGEVWWADLEEPVGSAPGYRRPVIVVQSNRFNQSRIQTVVVVPLTRNLGWARAPGNVRLEPRDTGLEEASVANVSQMLAVDREVLIERVGALGERKLALVLGGVALVLER